MGQPLPKKIKAQIINDYIIDYRSKPLGRGSYGEVRIAYNNKNKEDPKKLACKIISIKKNFRDARQELDMIGRLPYNPNLVNYEKVKLSTHDDQYIFMEYCDGGTLAAYLKSLDDDEYLSEEEIWAILNYINKRSNIVILSLKIFLSIKNNIKLLILDCQSFWNMIIKLLIIEVFIYLQYLLWIISKKLPLQILRIEITQQLNLNKFCYDLGTPLTIAPELFRKEYRDNRYKYNEDFTKVDMFSLGCVIYNMIYKIECHPYIGDIAYNFNNQSNEDKKDWLFNEVNKQNDFKKLENRKCSLELLNLVKSLCDKDIKNRMSFEELSSYKLPQKYLSKNNQQDLLIKQEQKNTPLSIVENNTASDIQYLIPQPRISIQQSYLQECSKNNNNNFLQPPHLSNNASYLSLSEICNFQSYIQQPNKIVISDDELNTEPLNENEEIELEQQLENKEKEINEINQKNKINYIILDFISYLRKIIFFFNKVELFIGGLIQIIGEKMLENGQQNKQLQIVIKNLNKVRCICLLQAINRIKWIEKDLVNKFTIDLIVQFKQFIDFDKISKELTKDQIQLKEYLDEIPQKIEPNKEESITILEICMMEIDQVFHIFNEKPKLQYILITYWYIYQIYLTFKGRSFFHDTLFEKNIQLFTRYYDKIENRIEYDQLFKMIVDAMQLIQPGFAFNE